MKGKWFYPAQQKIAHFLEEKHGENYSCNFQTIGVDTVHENYRVWDDQQNLTNIHFIIRRPALNNRGIIETYYGKYEDTMQYFKEN